MEIDRFVGAHSLIVPSADSARVSGIRLDPHTYRQIAHMILGDWGAVNATKNVEVSSINLLEYAHLTHMWHVRVGNAILDISPEKVVCRFDMPLPKEADK